MNASPSNFDQLQQPTVAAVQGGLLLAETSRDSELLRLAFDAAIGELHAHAPAAA